MVINGYMEKMQAAVEEFPLSTNLISLFLRLIISKSVILKNRVGA